MGQPLAQNLHSGEYARIAAVPSHRKPPSCGCARKTREPKGARPATPPVAAGQQPTGCSQEVARRARGQRPRALVLSTDLRRRSAPLGGLRADDLRRAQALRGDGIHALHQAPDELRVSRACSRSLSWCPYACSTSAGRRAISDHGFGRGAARRGGCRRTRPRRRATGARRNGRGAAMNILESIRGERRSGTSNEGYLKGIASACFSRVRSVTTTSRSFPVQCPFR